ncbi:unnamed protein product [Adineta steineri]|uniref:Uncharacterized protein n=1 Tax=Adineta steineri TaxID=433720 RepID=A0A814WJ75_9BILA|nr:unnamed protein product [Adineta steineri]CAF1204740.1 unnamed protein product [Adineta steineri]
MENYLRSRAKSQNDIDLCHAKQELSFKNERRKSYLWWLKHRKLYAYDQVPKHLQTNPFIIKGYRNYDNLFTAEHSTDYLMLLFYVLSVIACMLASTILHLLSGCSAKTYSACLQLDLLGYCAQPYFPAQIVFSPNNGQTIFAIDEINQRASKTIDYGDQGRQTSYGMINSLIQFQKIGLVHAKILISNFHLSTNANNKVKSKWRTSTLASITSTSNQWKSAYCLDCLI